MASYVGKTPARQGIVADNTITSSQIVDNTISTSDILDSTITGSDLASNIVINTTGSITSGALTVDTNTLHVDSTNNRVGIGTTTPTTALEIYNASGIKTGNVSGTGIFKADGGSTQIGSFSNHKFYLLTNNTVRAAIDTSGNLGIGTTSPTQKLTVYSSSSAQIHLNTVNPAIRFSSDTAGNSNSTRAFIGYATNNSAFMTGSTVGDLVISSNSTDSILLGTPSGKTVEVTGSGVDITGDVGICNNLTVAGALTACGLSYPTADGTSGQVIQTDGAGNLTFATASGGGGDVVDDTTPQLGGNLDLNSFDITGTNICIDASGCLGIGNQAAPTSSYNIDIAASGTHGNIRLQRANVSSQYMLIGVSDGSRHDIQVYGDKTLRIMNRATTQDLGIEFWTNSTCKMKIDGLGNIYLGSPQYTPNNVINSTNTCTGMVFECGGYIGVSTNSECALILNRRTSDGDIAQFRKDGTAVGSIGAISGTLFIGTGDTGIRFNDGGDNIFAFDTSTSLTRDNAVDLGASGGRWKDLYLGGGLYVGGTGSANLLDDYEEGTWTPVYLGTSSSPTITYDSSTHGVYNKVGNVVFARGYIKTDSVSGGAGGLKLGGFPFFFTSQVGGATVLIQSIFSWGTAPAFTVNDPISDMVNFYDSSGNILTISALATGSNSNEMTFLAVYQI